MVMLDYYQKALDDALDCGDTLQSKINNIIAMESYCLKIELYIRILKNKKEIADKLLNEFRSKNDKLFQQAMDILDIAIEFGNIELAKAALDIVETMKKTYPQFYQSFYRSLF